MPFKYKKGVLSLFLHCQNYESLLESDEIEENEEERGLEKIFIGSLN